MNERSSGNLVEAEQLGQISVELFFGFHNKFSENTCSLTPYRGYISICAHVLQIFSYVLDVSDRKFVEILRAYRNYFLHLK